MRLSADGPQVVVLLTSVLLPPPAMEDCHGIFVWTGFDGKVFLDWSYWTGLFGIGAANPIDPTC